jgi:hypothetical protein
MELGNVHFLHFFPYFSHAVAVSGICKNICLCEINSVDKPNVTEVFFFFIYKHYVIQKVLRS